MKTINIENKELKMDDDIYEFLKDKFIEAQCGYPILRLHRMFNIHTKERPFIDHINGDIFDIRRSNLRPVNYYENNCNRRGAKISTSKYKGVNFGKKSKCYTAKIFINGSELFLGRYNNEKEAAFAYDIAAIYSQKEFARLNFDKDNYKNMDIEAELYKILTKKPRNNTTGFRGVSISKQRGKFLVHVKNKKRKTVYLGSFDDPKLAAIKRDNYYRENGIRSNSRLNFPTLEELMKKLTTSKGVKNEMQ